MIAGAYRTLGITAAVCGVCSLAVSTTAVLLAERQQRNREHARRNQVLAVAGPSGVPVGAPTEAVFAARIRPRVIDLEAGRLTAASADGFDARAVRLRTPPPNPARVRSVPDRLIGYEVLDARGNPEALVLPVEGAGLWSTLHGYIALERDGNTVRGLSFYDHGETPGLGAEIDAPAWRALWPGRRIYGASGEVVLSVVKGHAGPPEAAPYRVDAITGATLTSRGVSDLIAFWFGPEGYAPLLARWRSTP
jgi:Na+-transporting NADH:ubiquinone oxidoreductase subunit C